MGVNNCLVLCSILEPHCCHNNNNNNKTKHKSFISVFVINKTTTSISMCQSWSSLNRRRKGCYFLGALNFLRIHNRILIEPGFESPSVTEKPCSFHYKMSSFHVLTFIKLKWKFSLVIKSQKIPNVPIYNKIRIQETLQVDICYLPSQHPFLPFFSNTPISRHPCP